ncbi:DUF6011 domain-containing protein [Streptomyces sp. NPDC046928]|uniref:DUF6011 domain-containing protein n=1 Tax=Streptomyces sp. NPDC046928 TaxID=3155021 RepID=UPI0033F38507
MTGGAEAPAEAPRCMACGRLLHDEESRRLRLGPVCRKRLERLLAPRPRRIRTQTAGPHPRAIPPRYDTQLEFELWDDDEDDTPTWHRRITDVPTGALL